MLGVERDENTLWGTWWFWLGLSWWCQLARGRPTTSFQGVKRVVISWRYCSALSRWRRGRKCGDMPLKAARKRGAPPIERKRFIARSRCLMGWWESGRCGALLLSIPLRVK